MLLQFIYKRILKKLNLSNSQLDELITSLTPDKICSGGFVEGSKMCPNTTALNIKFNGQLPRDTKQIKEQFKRLGVTLTELSVWFYLLYDIPAMLSDKWKADLLKELQLAAENSKN